MDKIKIPTGTKVYDTKRENVVGDISKVFLSATSLKEEDMPKMTFILIPLIERDEKADSDSIHLVLTSWVNMSKLSKETRETIRKELGLEVVDNLINETS